MKSIVFVGLDVHTIGITLCCLQPNLFEEDVFFGHVEVKTSAVEVKRFLERIQERYREKWKGNSDSSAAMRRGVWAMPSTNLRGGQYYTQGR